MTTKFYHVVLGKKHMDLVIAKNPKEAVLIIEKLYGPSTKYSTTEDYKAIEA